MAVKKMSQSEVINDKATKIMNGVAIWCAFYRANPQRFCKDYLNINLKLFQKILIFMMNYSTNFMYLASRGQGKTFLVAIFCVVRCILYPDTKICISSKSRPQAIEVLEKIKTILMPNSANLRMEIKGDPIINQANAFIEFRNGSLIKVVTSNDNARHNRANILIVDEFRMVDLEIINKVLRKFLTAPRQPKYLNKPEYAHLAERNKEMYLSSCWYQSHWSYEKAKAYCTNLVNDTKKYFICGLPYQLAIKENLLSAEQIADEMSESDFNEIGFGMEMECLWFSDTDGSLYSYEDISKTRKISLPFYPKRISDRLNDKRLKIPPRTNGEKRILSADIALMSSKKRDNDATAVFINQLLPTQNERYINNIVYTDNFEGLHTDDQALIIRKLFDEYDCTDLCLDTVGIGFGVYDALVRDIYDPETGHTYEALSCCNDPEMADRCISKSAPKVIWSIKGTAKFNSDCALSLREGFRQGRIRLLTSEFEAEEVLKEIKGYISLTATEKMRFQMPYIHTTLLINELINLEYDTKNGLVKVQEKNGMRKDRYSSLSYNFWVSNQLALKLRKPKIQSSVKQFFVRSPAKKERW